MAVRYGKATEMNMGKKGESYAEIREDSHTLQCMILEGHSNKASKELLSELSTVR